MIDELMIENHHSLYLSGHPLDRGGKKGSEELEKRAEHFIQELKAREIPAISVLTPKEEFEKANRGIKLADLYRAKGLEIIHFPIEASMNPDPNQAFVRFIEKIIAHLEHDPLLLHCLAGCGRTGLVASAVLIHLGREVADAIDAVNRARSTTTLSLKQIFFLKDYYRYLIREKTELLR